MLTVLLTSPRVAPGLLSGRAWSALHAASAVLAPSESHPVLAALAEAHVVSSVVPDQAGASLGEFLSSPDHGSSVVWLAWPGEGLDPSLVGALSVAHEVIDGSYDLPGAHLLDLVSVMDTLRVSCPWDREQTHESLLRYLLEEAYEAAETIENGDLGALREEIGDVMFQAFFHARIASEVPAAEGGFDIDDVADTLAAKLIRRHPHVFGSVSVSSAADVNANWEEIKKAERAAKAAAGDEAAPSALDGVPFGQPALSLAAQLQRRAARAGYVPEAAEADDVGEELMQLATRAQAAGLDPEITLRDAARRFAERVRAWEQGQS